MTLFNALKTTVVADTAHGRFEWGTGKDFVLFAGPDIFEDHGMVNEVAVELKRVCAELGIPWILKCSYDKANRSSSKSFRGPGMKKALDGLAKIKSDVGCALITDVHECDQVKMVAEFAVVIQIPAFLSRQTDLLQEVAKTGKVMQIKKGQFLAPWDMKAIVEKAYEMGNRKILLCDRGTSFGYNRLVTDMTGLVEMRNLGLPVIMDATHSVQLPGGKGDSSDGRRDMIAVLARGAAAVGVDGFFLETHPNPDKALCDGPNSLALKDIPALLKTLKAIHKVVSTDFR